jgi:hypothetical protein
VLKKDEKHHPKEMKKHLHFFQSHFISQMSKKKGKIRFGKKDFYKKKKSSFL